MPRRIWQETLPVEFWVMAEYSLLIEWGTAVACKIGANSRALRDGVMQSRDARNFGEDLPHPPRKSIEQAIDELEKRQIRISYGGAGEQPRINRIAGQNALEPGKIFGYAVL